MRKLFKLATATLDKKTAVALSVATYILKKAHRPAVAFTGGKDSLVVLDLLRTIGGGQVPLEVIQVDTSVKFPQVMAYVDKLVRLWNLSFTRVVNRQALEHIRIAADREVCCHALKTQALAQAIENMGIDFLYTGVRWDEGAARADETFISPRLEHTRVHPILPFSEKDIWTYIRNRGLPYCSLYDEGYRSLGCVPCTTKSPGEGERSGRAQDKETNMTKLRQLGYF